MKAWPLLVLAVGASVEFAGCEKKPPTDAEIAAAIQGCGIPPGGASFTFGKNRTFLVRGRDDLKYKQFMCLINWGEARGYKSKIALIGLG